VPAASEPVALLAAAQRRDPARPLLTWYGPQDARVELSVGTVANWVAKTAGLLVDELGAEADDVVCLDLPAHWLAPVWALATWTAGCRLVLGADDGAAVTVLSAGAALPPAATLVVVGTGPFGGPAGGPLPPGACDYGREVLAQPDRYAGGPAATLPDDLAAVVAQRATTLPAHARVLVPAERFDEQALVDAVLVPLLLDGSAVLVQGPHDEADIARTEKALTTGRS
jgi:uncharacterized protein (TIGR03089 family)